MNQTDPVTGLTGAEVAARRAQGLGNRVDTASSRGYLQILRSNFLTFLNVTLFGVGIVLVALGLPRDAILTSGFALLNAAIGVVQEVFAKRRLDRIALLSRARAAVVRDGTTQEADPGNLVIGDVLALKAGDQAMLDGVLAAAGTVEMDESLLTGESDAIHKEPGDPVYAGSYCVAGSGRYVATKVSAESVASGIAADARAFRVVLTPLQREVNAIVRLLILVSSTMLAMLFLSSLVWDVPFKDTVVASAVVLGIVPTGLFLMITITYSMASVRISSRNALVQQVNAVESLSNVDVFCMDKTGTLTSNALSLAHVQPLGASEDEARRMLGAMAHSAASRNATTEAIARACDGPAVTLVDEVPFSSARKWSAVAADDQGLRGVYALGAPEMLDRLLARSAGQPPAEWTAQGLRVLLAAFSPVPNALHDTDGQVALPDDMAPLAWIALADELRPDSREAIAGFQDAGIELKIISGDNPETVAALARQAGLAGDATLISGVELAEMDDAALEDAAVRGTVFGRTTPDQKSRLVRALKRRGYYVAMTGDGVNDVPSLKQADLGIAMESGSQATRMVADIVLLGDSFGALPAAFTEGQRVRRGLQDVLSLFLTRVMVVAMALVLCAVVRIGFPFSPGNVTLLTLLTVGIPTFGLALWARPGAPPRSMMRALASFVLPAAISLAFAAFAVYAVYFLLYDVDLVDLRASQVGELMAEDPVARDALTYLLILAGLALVPFASPPTDWWAVLGEKERDWRPTLLAVAMIPLYVVILAVEPVRDFFGTRLLSAGQYALIALVVVAWVIGLRHAYQTRLVDRFLGLD